MKTTTMPKNETDSRRRSLEPRRNRRRGAQDGSSLIEIMVVLVVLLIGVFLAIRIFPAGLATLTSTENRGRADHLAQQELGDTVSNAVNLPGGILAASVAGPDSSGLYTLSYNTTQDPDNLAGSDLNNATYIKGEPVKIPVPIGSSVSSYLVKFGPMQMDDTTGMANNAPTSSTGDASHYGAYLNVTSGPLGITNYASQGGTNSSVALNYLQGQLNCLVDYGSGTSAYILLAPNATGTYTLTYSYYSSATTGASATITNATIAAMGGTWQAITLPSGSNGMVPGSLTITRVFDRVSVTGDFSTTNPFQYKLAANNITGTTVNPGLIFFNPIGAGLTASTPSGPQAFTAYIDYFTANWHILHDDIQVPTVQPNATTGLIPVKLTMDVLKRLGDANPDNTSYVGLYNSPSTTDPTAQNDVDVVNLGAVPADPKAVQTPELPQGNLVHGVKTPIGGNSPAYYVDTDPKTGTYRTGTIYVDPSSLPQGSQIRVYYQADGDWAVGLRKAYANYTPELDSSATTSGVTTTTNMTAIVNRPATNSYSTFGIDRSGGNRLYFWRQDLNKSVMVSLQYVKTSGGTSTVVRVPPTQFTIDNVTADKMYAYIDLVGGANANALSAADKAGIMGDPNWTVYGPIQGVSVKTRIIWHDNNNTTNNWRIQDLDTFLTPNGS